MIRPCDVCGTSYEAKRATSKYCSSACRVRKARGAEVVELPQPESPLPASSDGPVYEATLRTLTDADRATSPLGAAALALARRMDSPGADTGSAIAAVARQLEATLSAATRGAGAATAPGQLKDELTARRAARGA